MAAVYPSSGGGEVWVHYGGMQDGVETYVLTTNSEAPCEVPVDAELAQFREAKLNFYDSVAGVQRRPDSREDAHARPRWKLGWGDDAEDAPYDPTRYSDDAHGHENVPPFDHKDGVVTSVVTSRPYTRGYTAANRSGVLKRQLYSRLTFNGELQNVPGPGTYHIDKPHQVSGKQNAPAFSFGGSHLKLKGGGSSAPSPGHYTMSTAPIDRPKAPSFSLGPKRGIKLETAGPGPAGYAKPSDHQTNLKTRAAPSYSLGGKVSWSDETAGPGPQKHASNTKRPGDKTAPTAVMMWKPKRNDETAGPGPAKFHPSSIRADTSQYVSDVHERTTAMRSAPAFTMKGPFVTKVSAGPGPNAYGLAEKKKKTAPSATFGTAVEIPAESVGPGPMAYAADLDATKKKIGGGFKFATSTKMEVEVVGPGPGKYHMGHRDERDAANSGFTIQSRPAEPKAQNLPGPDYLPVSVRNGPSAVISTAPRAVGGAETAGPGPGKYGEVASKPTGPQATITGKPADKKAELLPGPGEYMVLEKRAVPSFSMKGGTKRTDLASNSAGPGPGKYGNIEDKPRGPNARITGRHLEKKVSLADQMRGPGSHYIPDSHANAAKGDALTFGKPSGLRAPSPDLRDFGLTHTVAPPAKGEAKTMGRPSAASGPSPDRRDIGVAHSGIPAALQRAAKTMGTPSVVRARSPDKRSMGVPHIIAPPMSANKVVGTMGRPSAVKPPSPDRRPLGIALHEEPFRSLGPSINLGSMGRHKEVRRDQMPGPGAYVVDRTSRGLGFASNKGAMIVGRPTERKVLRSEQTPGPGENYVAPINRIKGGATMKPPTARRKPKVPTK